MKAATEEFRVRIDRDLAKKARRVTEEIGTTPGAVVRLLFQQLVKRRAIPFPLQADTPESEVLGSAERRSKMWDVANEGKSAAR
jgi:addiction module RelB/DinJ family antitoxin